MAALWLDLRFALRSLQQTRAYTLAALLTLALTIGADTAIFSVVHAVLLRPLGFRHAARLVWIHGVRPDRSDAPFSLPDFNDYRDHLRSIDSLAASGMFPANLTGRGDAERLQGIRVSANLFETLGVSAVLGRVLEPDDDRPASPRVVVLGHPLWQRRFGSDPAIVGQSLELNGVSYAVVGVLPPDFLFPARDSELAVPLVPDADPWRLDRNSVNFLRFIGRLAPGATTEQSSAEMNALARRLREQFPEPNARKLGVKLESLGEHFVGEYSTALWVLFGAVGFVLLIACANLANLNLSRVAARRRELAIRAALGGTRLQLLRQLIVETLVVTVAGGMLGAALAWRAVRLLVAWIPAGIPRAPEIGTDGSVLLFCAAMTGFAAVATGLVPALALSRSDLARSLQEEGRSSTAGMQRTKLRSTFIVAEVALSVALLVGAGLLMRSFASLLAVRPGFKTGNVLTVRLSLPAARYAHREDVVRFYDALHLRAERLPGVTAAGFVNVLPLTGMIARVDFTIVCRTFAREEVPGADFRVVGRDYFRAMGIPLLGGRELSDGDTDRTTLVCLINESIARRFWPGGQALGAHVRVDDNDAGAREVEVVGIVGDVKQIGLDAPSAFTIYMPVRQTHEDGVVWVRNNQYWILRTTSDPLALAGAFREQLRAVDSDVAASNVRSMEQYMFNSIAPRRFNLQLLGLFAAAALALALVGVYAVLSYSVTQRSHEMGVRMSLGAQRGDILRLVIGGGLRLVGLGWAIGVLGALALGRILARLLFGVSPRDPATLLGVSLVLLTAAAAAMYIPARRATRVDPLTVLRAE